METLEILTNTAALTSITLGFCLTFGNLHNFIYTTFTKKSKEKIENNVRSNSTCSIEP